MEYLSNVMWQFHAWRVARLKARLAYHNQRVRDLQ